MGTAGNRPSGTPTIGELRLLIMTGVDEDVGRQGFATRHVDRVELVSTSPADVRAWRSAGAGAVSSGSNWCRKSWTEIPHRPNPRGSAPRTAKRTESPMAEARTSNTDGTASEPALR